MSSCSLLFLLLSERDGYLRWCEIDEEGTKFLLGDAYGRLAMVVFDPSDRGKLFLMPLGEVGSTAV